MAAEHIPPEKDLFQAEIREFIGNSQAKEKLTLV